ncbi:MAG: DUF2752 domain-containing protein [Planctomycetes bacterium]|nr:DUF2752 domain-containing protein [Planctomycetota bacterium]
MTPGDSNGGAALLPASARTGPGPSGMDAPWDRILLAVFAGVVVLAALLELQPDGYGLHLGPFPVTSGGCFSRTVFGVNCPGCGLTRSFVSLAHGRWREAWRYNRAGGLLFAALVLQFPWRAWRLLRGRPHPRPAERAAEAGGWLLLVALVANWLWNLVSGTPPLP